MAFEIYISQLGKLDRNTFIEKYELYLLEYIESIVRKNWSNREFIFDDEIEPDYIQMEIEFLNKLNSYIGKRFLILQKYFEHCIETGKYGDQLSPMAINELITNNTYKNLFVIRRMFKLDSSIKLEKFQTTTSIFIDQNQPDKQDISSTKGTEKIIYLQKLGILDYLKEHEPFRSSTNALAAVVGAITGISKVTAQSYLNPISNPTTDQKNNPLNSTSKVEKIRQTLINLGFNPSK
ncbi:MAG: hypothetical protein ACQEWG_11445 [Bacteroidota bacterium]